MDNEEWRPVHCAPDRYEVSNFGNVRSIPRMQTGKKRRFRPSITIKPSMRGKYLSVGIFLDGRLRLESIHVLVARAFIGEQPEGRPFVDHVNGDRLDNRASNLRYATVSLNVRNSRATNSASGFRGVGFNKQTQRNPWFARAILRGKQIWIGSFPTPEKASEAYEAFCERTAFRDEEMPAIS